MSFEVTYASVTEASTKIRTSAGAIKTQLDDLERRVLRVVGTWDGEAKEAFQTTHRGWKNEVQNLEAKLNAIAVALQTSNDNYSATDRRNAAGMG